ncbi:MAG: hypothetical protein CXZ00_07185 [Acidobacteria bacterium]|nr:MAG: hypothetical protein CXZ00_07185 [Acidobacteriota bacterium]
MKIRAFLLGLMIWAPLLAFAQNTVTGAVTTGKDYRVHRATVLLVPANRTTFTDSEGRFEFRDVPRGTYELIVHSSGLGDQRRSITVKESLVVADFHLEIAPVHEQVTVTASGNEETTFESFQSVTSLESIQLTQKAQPSLGEALENQPGVAKRSFGPGSARPVLRGFDGDRVLVMVDGLGAGSLGSQSGDHGENIDVLNLERLEIVRGPATLLYGSSAIGGVVNAITGRQSPTESAHEGWSGYASALGGTTNDQGGGNGGLNFSTKRWSFRGGGGGQRTGDYSTPLGTVVNSRTRSYDGYGAVGWTGVKTFWRAGYDYDNREYGIPFAAFLESGGTAGPDEEVVNLRLRRHDAKVTFGARDLNAPITGINGIFNFVRYRHGEYDGDELGTYFKNDQYNYRFTLDHKKVGRLSGKFGISGMHRDYETIGDEALAPPVIANSFALFDLETFDIKKIGLQFGGRFEHTGFSPDHKASILPERSFTGFSGSFGVRVPLWKGGLFVTNYTHSFRAPALEELYNNGPHPGNLAFEIGNPNLKQEMGDGIDVSLRHQSERWHGDVNFFYYNLRDFVFLAPNGNITDGLFEAEYLQGGSRYLGAEANLHVALHNNVWLLTGMDVVNASLTEAITTLKTGAVVASGTPLPRIPPLRARVGLDFRYKGLSVRPEVIAAHSQNDIFTTETRTAGYTVVNLDASYTVAREHNVQVFTVSSFNLGNRLYRNHLSFIKNLAPEIGRGVRFSYTIRFQ